MSIASEFIKFNKSKKFSLPEELILPCFRNAYDDIHSKGGHTEFIFSGGRGSIKSTFASEITIEYMKNNKNVHCLAVRRVKETLKDSVFAQFLWSIDKLGLTKEVKITTSPLEITFIGTGQKIYFRGADDPVAIKSIKPRFGYIGVIWFEELDQFRGDKDVRSVIQSAIRGGDEALILKTFNPPKSNASWVNKYVSIQKPSMLVTKNTYLDVPPEWLGKAFIEQATELKINNPEAYDHEYLGISNGTGGSVFTNLTIRNISDDEIRLFDRIYCGIDWGWFPDYNRFHEMYYNKGRLYIYGEVSCRKTPNDKFRELLDDYGLNKGQHVICDSAATELKSIYDFRSWGYNFHGAKKGPGSVDAGMKWLCSLQEIIIDPSRCPMAAGEFMNYEYLRDKNGDVVSGYPDKDNHSIDAVRYALEPVWRKPGR